MKKLALITSIAATLFLTACSTKTVPATQTPTSTTIVQANTTPGYTPADVATHTTASDCRSIVGNKVYNLSSYFGKHPGGDAKLQTICGKDGTAAFNAQHAGSSNANTMLASLFIGNVK